MPSGRMSLAGDFNLLAETADAKLVATLPVATNLPWVVALLGGIPAAAGVLYYQQTGQQAGRPTIQY